MQSSRAEKHQLNRRKHQGLFFSDLGKQLLQQIILFLGNSLAEFAAMASIGELSAGCYRVATASQDGGRGVSAGGSC